MQLTLFTIEFEILNVFFPLQTNSPIAIKNQIARPGEITSSNLTHSLKISFLGSSQKKTIWNEGNCEIEQILLHH